MTAVLLTGANSRKVCGISALRAKGGGGRLARCASRRLVRLRQPCEAEETESEGARKREHSDQSDERKRARGLRQFLRNNHCLLRPRRRLRRRFGGSRPCTCRVRGDSRFLLRAWSHHGSQPERINVDFAKIQLRAGDLDS